MCSRTKKGANLPSAEYSKFKAFQEDVKAISVLGILSLVFCLGIGIIFQIINLCKLQKYVDKQNKKDAIPVFNLENSHDIAEYDSTVRKLKNARIMTAIGLCISGFLLAFIFVNVIFAKPKRPFFANGLFIIPP